MKGLFFLFIGIFMLSSVALSSENNEHSGYKSHEERHSFHKHVEFSIDYWVAIPEGKFNFNNKNYDIRRDLYLKKAKDFGGKIIYDGIDYGWMNIIFTYTPLKFETKSTASQDIQVENFKIDKGKEYEIVYDFNSYDLGLLWDIGHLKEKTEDRLDIRAGFSGRYLDGSLDMKNEANQTFKEDFSKFILMFDVEAEVEVLPVHQDLTAEIILEYQVYVWNNEFMHDFIDSLRINYKRGFIEGGYRVIKYKFKKNNISTKTAAEGFFLSLGIMF